MPLTPAQAVAAEAAKRLLADEHLIAILNRITGDAAEKAVFLDDPRSREANRNLVLAISRIRRELQADADVPDDAARDDTLARSMEV